MKLLRRIALLALTIVMASGLSPSMRGGAESIICAEADRSWHDNGREAFQAKAHSSERKQCEERILKATILFFNDLHGNLMPFRVRNEDGSSAEVGGIAGMATLIREIRAENSEKGIKTFVLVAGDAHVDGLSGEARH